MLLLEGAAVWTVWFHSLYKHLSATLSLSAIIICGAVKTTLYGEIGETLFLGLASARLSLRPCEGGYRKTSHNSRKKI